MSENLRDALQAVAGAEPAVGDPYERFMHRRRRSRGLRVLFGVVVAAGTMFGFVRVFPGGTGAVPNDGFIPGTEVQPGFEPYERFNAEPLALTMLIPSAWEREVTEDAARVGPALADASTPSSFELRFGDLGACPVARCTPLAAALEDPSVLDGAGVRAAPKSLHVGSLTADATEVRYPARHSTAIAPWCAGCVGYYAEIGRNDLPMLIIAPSEASLRANAELVNLVLRTVRAG